MKMTLGEKIRKVRKGKMTQAELAEAIGVHEMTIRRWELGKNFPDVGALQKIASVLSIPLIELTDDDATPPPPVKQELPINNTKEHKEHTDMAYWGGVLDNLRRLSHGGADPSDVALITAMLENGINDLRNTKGGDNLRGGVVMTNYNSDNATNVHIE